MQELNLAHDVRITYLTRKDTGIDPLSFKRQSDRNKWDALRIHHTAAIMPDYDRDGFLHGDLDDIVRYMRMIKKVRPDLGDFPYSFMVFRGINDKHAVLCQGCGFDYIGAHTAGENSTTIGVCFAGNFMKETITGAMILAARIPGCLLPRALKAGKTLAHRDKKSTACPGDNVYSAMGFLQPPFDLSQMTEESGRVPQMFNPTLYLPGIVASCMDSSGGVHLLGEDWGVFSFNCPHYGSGRDIARHLVGRKPASIRPANPSERKKGYRIILTATSGEQYALPYKG